MPNHKLSKNIFPVKDPYRSSVDHDVANSPHCIKIFDNYDTTVSYEAFASFVQGSKSPDAAPYRRRTEFSATPFNLQIRIITHFSAGPNLLPSIRYSEISSVDAHIKQSVKLARLYQ